MQKRIKPLLVGDEVRYPTKSIMTNLSVKTVVAHHASRSKLIWTT